MYLGDEALVFAQPGLSHGGLAIEASSELFQLLLPNELGPQRQLSLVLGLLQALPRLRPQQNSNNQDELELPFYTVQK